MQQDLEKKRIYTVAEFNKSVRKLLEASYPVVWIEGEVSNLVTPASGHCYFSLKDETAQVRCALFKNRLKNISTVLENGKKIVAMAHVSLYEGRGEFQIIVETLEPAGEGLLRQKFEQLKNKLLAEGLFEASTKKAFPVFPKKIGVITSPTGAVIHDILTALKRRFPALPVVLYPTLVQGDQAAGNIAQVLEIACKRRECDVLILARGGGSLEDLWPFNEEVVARAIHASNIPVITGIGHETDTTIADWVADKRAPTPTAAAELISPDQAELLAVVNNFQKRLTRQIVFTLQNLSQKVDYLARHVRTPTRHIQQTMTKIQETLDKLARGLQLSLNKKNQALQLLFSTLSAQAPVNRIRLTNEILNNLSVRLNKNWNKKISDLKNRLHSLTRELNAISPLETMARGYSITRIPESGEIIRDASTIKSNDLIETILRQDVIVSKIKTIKKL